MAQEVTFMQAQFDARLAIEIAADRARQVPTLSTALPSPTPSEKFAKLAAEKVVSHTAGLGTKEVDETTWSLVHRLRELPEMTLE